VGLFVEADGEAGEHFAVCDDSGEDDDAEGLVGEG